MNKTQSGKSRRVRRAVSLNEAVQGFFARRGRAMFKTAWLWENWPMVMGDLLASLALPLGEHERVLLVGAEDNMILHELGYATQEILERANAFLDDDYFTKVRLELIGDRLPLWPPRTADNTPRTAAEKRVRPEGLGRLMNHFDPESAIGKAYRSYVRSFDED